MTRTQAPLISSPITLVPQLAPPRRTRPTAAIAVVLLGLVATGVWYGWATVALTRGLDDLDTRVLTQLDQASRATLDVHHRQLESVARVLVDDARIRTTLATPGIDAATIEDVLTDLQKASGHAAYAVLDARGVVRASVGVDALRQLDLGTSALVKQARESTSTSDVWVLGGRPLLLALAPVRLGDELSAFLVVGDVLAPELLAPGPDITASVIAGDRVVGGAEAAFVIPAATAAAQGQALVPGTTPERIARALPLSHEAVGATLVWTTVRHGARGALPLGGSPMLPALVMSLCLLAVLAAMVYPDRVSRESSER